MRMKSLWQLATALTLLAAAAIVPAAQLSTEEELLEKARQPQTKTEAIDLCREMAELYAGRGEHDLALKMYEQAIDLEPGKRRQYELLCAAGAAALAIDQYASSIDHYQRAVWLYPRREQARLGLAAAYEQSGLGEPARQEYRTALRYHPKSYRLNFRLASLYLRQGFNSQAMEYFRRALTLQPGTEVYVQMSRCAECAGDVDLAIAMLRQVDPREKTYETFIDLGRLLEAQGRDEESVESFKRAMAMAPARLEAYLHLSLLSLRKGEIAPALDLLSAAQMHSPEEGCVRFLKGVVHYQRGNLPAAKRELGAARDLARTEILRSYSEKFMTVIDSAR